MLKEMGEAAVESTDAANRPTLCRQYPAERSGISLRDYDHRHRSGRDSGKRRRYGGRETATTARSNTDCRRNRSRSTSAPDSRRRWCAAEYDPVDIVTEVINRAEQALHTANGTGCGQDRRPGRIGRDRCSRRRSERQRCCHHLGASVQRSAGVLLAHHANSRPHSVYASLSPLLN